MAYVGGPDAIEGPFSDFCCQQVTFPTAGTLTALRASWQSGGGSASTQVGYSATKPTAANAVTWLGKATIPFSNDFASSYAPDAPLDVPVPVTAGASLWLVWLGPSSTLKATETSSGHPNVGGAILGDMWFAASSTAPFSDPYSYQGNVQGVLTADEEPPEPPAVDRDSSRTRNGSGVDHSTHPVTPLPDHLRVEPHRIVAAQLPTPTLRRGVPQ